MISFENENLKAYQLLLRIEIALRELLKSSYETEFGSTWQKRLPGDLLKKIKESQKEENRPQFDFIRLGPLYYLTFGELLTLLQQKSGHGVTVKIGGECILEQLKSLFPLRNSVCHSRPVPAVGLKTIEVLYAQIETALTSNGLAHLLSSTDTGITQEEVAKEMIPALENILSNLSSLPLSFSIPDVFNTAVNQYWWAEDSLAGFNRASIDEACILAKAYSELPKGVGSAGIRCGFIQQHNMKQVVQKAISELEKV